MGRLGVLGRRCGERCGSSGQGQGDGSNNTDVDEWLNRIVDDQKNFLQNQFKLESQKEELNNSNNIDPW